MFVTLCLWNSRTWMKCTSGYQPSERLSWRTQISWHFIIRECTIRASGHAASRCWRRVSKEWQSDRETERPQGEIVSSSFSSQPQGVIGRTHTWLWVIGVTRWTQTVKLRWSFHNFSSAATNSNANMRKLPKQLRKWSRENLVNPMWHRVNLVTPEPLPRAFLKSLTSWRRRMRSMSYEKDKVPNTRQNRFMLRAIYWDETKFN